MKLKTTDFYLSAYLVSQGVELERIDKKSKKFVFEFGIEEEEANVIIQKFWQKGTEVVLYDFISSVKNLKVRMFADL